MREDCLLFIQNRPKRAGAQTSLYRIAQCDSIRTLSPAILTSSQGWLNEACKEKNISNFTSPWPSPRSLHGRLGGLKKFANKLAEELHDAGRTPRAIVANDHQECLVALAIAQIFNNIPVFAILRTPGMTEHDFDKYQCSECAVVFPRGKELTARVQTWTNRPVHCLEGSFSDDERHPPVTLPPEFPNRILVVGSEEPRKGFSDFIDALAILEQEHPDFPALTCVMTGEEPGQQTHSHDFRSRFEYVGRINGFVEFARNFYLAIHPSRSESFGMAPLELILAGIPTLVSRTGVIDQLNLPEGWCFKPESPRDMANKIAKIWQCWPDTGLEITSTQDDLLKNYHISHTANLIAQVVQHTAPTSH